MFKVSFFSLIEFTHLASCRKKSLIPLVAHVTIVQQLSTGLFIYRSDEALPAFEASMPGTVCSIYAPPLDERWGPSLNSPEQKIVYTNTED